MTRNLILRASESSIWVLLMLGVLIETLAIPQVSADLSNQYEEYRGDEFWIQLMLTSIVVAAQVSLFVIVSLLRRIRFGRLFNRASLMWVWGLVVSFALIAATLAFLLGWLMAENTLPPSLFIALFVAILLSVTVALVTVALRGVLRNAIDTQIEMQGVI